MTTQVIPLLTIIEINQGKVSSRGAWVIIVMCYCYFYCYCSCYCYGLFLKTKFAFMQSDFCLFLGRESDYDGIGFGFFVGVCIWWIWIRLWSKIDCQGYLFFLFYITLFVRSFILCFFVSVIALMSQNSFSISLTASCSSIEDRTNFYYIVFNSGILAKYYLDICDQAKVGTCQFSGFDIYLDLIY